METKLTRLSRQYATTLRKYLKQKPGTSLRSAPGLGRKAMALGLETLDLARIHATTLASLETSRRRDGIAKRAEIFFVEAITPIEATHRAARKTGDDLNRLARTLSQRTGELATSDRQLKRRIVQRKAAEQALKKSGEHRAGLLQQSGLVQEHLRRLAHQILSAHEDKRTKMSRELHDEIAQTLLGINVRLVTLKKEATVNTRGLKKEIANTQRLVEKSNQLLRRFAHELGKKHGT